jgi:hypothetical protein
MMDVSTQGKEKKLTIKAVRESILLYNNNAANALYNVYTGA